jgi:hypothetical protein
MTILNLASDGMHPVLISLALVVAREKKILRDELVSVCQPPVQLSKDSEQENAGKEKDKERVKATLSRWIGLGFFADNEGVVSLNFPPEVNESLDRYEIRLSAIFRELLLNSKNALPLWPTQGSVKEENTGRSADLCRLLAWCLAQDIYKFPTTYSAVDEVARLQLQTGRSVIQNDTRWTGLRFWARYLGFATGEESSFFMDPTIAVRAQLKMVFQVQESLTASEFVDRLSARVPVLDTGNYRIEVEQNLKLETWHPPSVGHLSTSLSFALRRLQKQGILSLESLADAGSRLALTGHFERTWQDFTHVRLLKETT